MPDPYRMIVISVIGSLLLLFGVIFYRYVYPKKKINLFILLILISLLPIINIFRPGSYESGDFNIHIFRTIEFYRSLTEGHLLPSWAAGLNATYGYPLFIFNYPLPYYIICLFHFFGFSFITSLKLFLATNYLLSGIFMYLAAQKFFKNNLAAFVSAIFYQFAPYHLTDLSFKIVIGELTIFVLLPLAFFSFFKFWETKKTLWFAVSSLLIGLLILGHVVLAFFSIILLVSYTFINKIMSKKMFLSTISIFVLGAISSVYVWLTPFFMAKYTIINKVDSLPNYPKLSELLYAPWRFGFLFQGPHGELSLLLGYTHIVVIATLLVLLFMNTINNKYKKHLLFWLIVFALLIFLVSLYSKSIWELVPFLKKTGGSHRLLIIVDFVMAVIAGHVTLLFIKRQKLIWIIVGITIFSTVLNWGQRRVLPQINDQVLMNEVWESTYKSEAHWYAAPKWRDVNNLWFNVLPKNYLYTVDGSIKIQNLKRTSTSHTYVVSTPKTTMFKESTLYFPGWQAFDNSKPIPTHPDNQGLITFTLPAGLHNIEVKYQDIVIYKILKSISVVGWISILVMIFYSLFKNIRWRKP